MEASKKACVRPKKPKRQYRGIECRFYKKRNAWLWRAVVTQAGRKVATGPFVELQSEAHAEYLRLKRDVLEERIVDEPDLTLGVALQIVKQDAKQRGVADNTFKCYYEYSCRHFLRYWDEHMPVKELGVQEIRWYVKETIEDGRSPNTVINMDFPMLSRLFKLSQLPDPVPIARDELGSTLKRIKPQMPFFEPEELPGLIERVRDPRGEGRRASPQSVVEEQADLVMLILMTGVRALELNRVRIDDIDLDRSTMFVRSKDKARPRTIHLVGPAHAAVARQLRRAREAALAGRNQQMLLYMRPGRVAGIMQSTKSRIGEPRLHCRALRHSFITGLLAAGETSLDVMGLAGHVRLSTTDRYVHRLKHRQVEISSRLADRLGFGAQSEDDATSEHGHRSASEPARPE
jgi:integrase